MTDLPIWEAIPFTEQRYQFLVEIESGVIWWDPKWRHYRKSGTARGSFRPDASIDFVTRFGLAYKTQKTNFSGWFQCGLTTDGQILIAKWREQEGKKPHVRRESDS